MLFSGELASFLGDGWGYLLFFLSESDCLGSDRVVSDSSLAVCFPFAFSSLTGFGVLLLLGSGLGDFDLLSTLVADFPLSVKEGYLLSGIAFLSLSN